MDAQTNQKISTTPLSKTEPETKPTDNAEPTFKTKIHVKVFSPFRTFYDGDAFSLSAENETGPFDVLAGHHKFLSLVKAGNVTVRDDSGAQTIEISNGLLHVSKDIVTLFLDV